MISSLSIPPDGGPLYAETHLGRFPVEPWNTASNLVFLLVLIYWAVRTRFRFSAHPVTVASLPILAVGFVGGTLYHALRNNDLWRLLDAGPIAGLVLLASIYFWKLVLGGTIRAAFVVAVPAVLYRVASGMVMVSQQAMLMLGYAFLAGIVIVPAMLHCRLSKWKGLGALGGAVFCFALAFFCRLVDLPSVHYGVPMGTHFLWHLYGGCAAFFMMRYLFDAESVAEKSGECEPVALGPSAQPTPEI